MQAITEIDGDTATVRPLHHGDRPRLAALLLEAAGPGNARSVRSVSLKGGGRAYTVPVAVAEAAGLIPAQAAHFDEGRAIEVRVNDQPTVEEARGALAAAQQEVAKAQSTLADSQERATAPGAHAEGSAQSGSEQTDAEPTPETATSKPEPAKKTPAKKAAPTKATPRGKATAAKAEADKSDSGADAADSSEAGDSNVE
ncbi:MULTISPECIES: hypothetical protein [Nocardia]|uniref:hypothetical protein n=1 Tax=Nocardia TaxID=1817 RepID=UPI002456644C|nr:MULTISPECIES: hypothetical protein [Nocardia]